MDVDSIVLHFGFCLSSHRQIGPARMGGLIKSVGSSQRQISPALMGGLMGRPVVVESASVSTGGPTGIH